MRDHHPLHLGRPGVDQSSDGPAQLALDPGLGLGHVSVAAVDPESVHVLQHAGFRAPGVLISVPLLLWCVRRSLTSLVNGKEFTM